MHTKLNQLIARLTHMSAVLIGFSGGVDSTFLLQVAKNSLGKNVTAITVDSPLLARNEFKYACKLAKTISVKHLVIHMKLDDIIKTNTADRCYTCKYRIFSAFRNYAEKHNITTILDGSNIDDQIDYRPGHQALHELGIVSPLADLGFTKQDIRLASKEFGLPTWNAPSMACLASRFPYGEAITNNKLAQVEKAEIMLESLGFKHIRVRHHGSIARIEVDNLALATENAKMIHSKIKALGFDYIALDLLGYRTGSLNEVLWKKND